MFRNSEKPAKNDLSTVLWVYNCKSGSLKFKLMVDVLFMYKLISWFIFIYNLLYVAWHWLLVPSADVTYRFAQIDRLIVQVPWIVKEPGMSPLFIVLPFSGMFSLFKVLPFSCFRTWDWAQCQSRLFVYWEMDASILDTYIYIFVNVMCCMQVLNCGTL